MTLERGRTMKRFPSPKMTRASIRAVPHCIHVMATLVRLPNKIRFRLATRRVTCLQSPLPTTNISTLIDTVDNVVAEGSRASRITASCGVFVPFVRGESPASNVQYSAGMNSPICEKKKRLRLPTVTVTLDCMYPTERKLPSPLLFANRVRNTLSFPTASEKFETMPFPDNILTLGFASAMTTLLSPNANRPRFKPFPEIPRNTSDAEVTTRKTFRCPTTTLTLSAEVPLLPNVSQFTQPTASEEEDIDRRIDSKIATATNRAHPTSALGARNPP